MAEIRAPDGGLVPQDVASIRGIHAVGAWARRAGLQVGSRISFPYNPARARALEKLAKGIANEYRDQLDRVSEYEAHLQPRVDTLERLGDALRGVRRALALDEEIPF